MKHKKEKPKICKDCGKVIKEDSNDNYLDLEGNIFCEDCALTYFYKYVLKKA